MLFGGYGYLVKYTYIRGISRSVYFKDVYIIALKNYSEYVWKNKKKRVLPNNIDPIVVN